jgi:hypothetical protein
MRITRPLLLILLCFSFYSGFSQQHYNVSTYAGLDSAGYRNGKADTALFNAPTGLAVDTMGNVYVADTYNNVIRKVSTTGAVTTYGGNDTVGYRNGTASTAEFNTPFGVCTDKAGNVYVADTYNNVIRKISTGGQVTTYAGTGAAGYVNGADSIAQFWYPVGVAADTSGNIYVTDNGNQVVREILTSGSVITFAGNDTIGYRNGNADTAEFGGLYGIAVDDSGTVYVTEYVVNDIRKIRKGVVTEVAGVDTLYGAYGYENGKVPHALFNNPAGIVVDDSGAIYVADEYNNAIRKIKDSVVTTIAGNTTLGYVDGIDSLAEFNSVIGLGMDKKGNFYVADDGNNLIREVSPVAPLGLTPVVAKNGTMLAYPNPCSDKLIIAAAPAGKAEMFDVMGREVWSNTLFKAPYILSTADLSPGVYFLRVSDAKQSAVKKIVIER